MDLEYYKKAMRRSVFGPLMYISPTLATKIAYFGKFKKTLNLNNPQDFNEKIQWLKLYNQKKEIIDWVDKVQVKRKLEHLNLEELIIPTYGVYNEPNEINWDLLPNSFVIKLNNSSGLNIFVNDKKDVNKQGIIQTLNKWKKIKFANYAMEPQYNYIDTKIMIEKLLEYTPPLYDYRFFCFDGQPKFLYVSVDGEINEHGISDKKTRKNYYDLNFKKLNFLKNDNDELVGISKPENFSEMLNYAKELSKDFPFVRVDFFNIDGKIYFGEMTFTPSSGFTSYYNDETLNDLGNMIKLPDKKYIGFK